VTELDRLLQQTRQITERIRVLSEELQALRIKYQLLNERHTRSGGLFDVRRSEEAPTQM
jgi:hypothetical protein